MCCATFLPPHSWLAELELMGTWWKGALLPDAPMLDYLNTTGHLLCPDSWGMAGMSGG